MLETQSIIHSTHLESHIRVYIQPLAGAVQVRVRGTEHHEVILSVHSETWRRDGPPPPNITHHSVLWAIRLIYALSPLRGKALEDGLSDILSEL